MRLLCLPGCKLLAQRHPVMARCMYHGPQLHGRHCSLQGHLLVAAMPSRKTWSTRILQMTDCTLKHGCERAGFVSCSPRGGTVTSDRIKCTGKGCLNANVYCTLRPQLVRRALSGCWRCCTAAAALTFEPAPCRTLMQPPHTLIQCSKLQDPGLRRRRRRQ